MNIKINVVGEKKMAHLSHPKRTLERIAVCLTQPGRSETEFLFLKRQDLRGLSRRMFDELMKMSVP